MCAAAIRIDCCNLKLFGFQVSFKSAACLNFIKLMEVSRQLLKFRFPKLGLVKQKRV